MNKELRFKQTDDQKVYFVSDLHWNHNPIKWTTPLWKSRGYNSVNEMNDDIIDQINNTVRPNDILWNLGDITLNCTENQFNELLSRINCQNVMTLWGNHNNPAWGVYQKEVKNVLQNSFSTDSEIYPLRYRNIVFYGNYQEISVDGQMIILNHYPIYVYNYMKDGAWHLCGHSHCNLPLSQADNLASKILDVGWEGLKRPYSMDDIRAIMNKKNVLKADHHA